MIELDYLTDTNGKAKAVVIPIKIWNQLFTGDEDSVEEMSESMENYALNKAMDEAKKTPLLDRQEALAFLDV